METILFKVVGCCICFDITLYDAVKASYPDNLVQDMPADTDTDAE